MISHQSHRTHFSVLLFMLVATLISSVASRSYGGARQAAWISPRVSLNQQFAPSSFRSTNNNSPLTTCLECPRGGAAADDSDDESEDEDSDYQDDDEDEDEDFDSDDEEEDFDLDTADFENAEEEFHEDNFVEQALSMWSKTPPLTKTYLGASMAATAYGFALNKNEFPSWLSLDWNAIAHGQVWRLVTGFLSLGPFGLGYVMTCHFVWTYMSTLERLNHSTPYDFWISIWFGQLCMLVAIPALKLKSPFPGHNLSTFLVYIWARYHEGLDVDMYGLFNTKAELLPWFFLAQTFLLEGEPPVLDFLGIVFGHIYYHCKSVGLLRAPPSLVAWYKGDSALARDLRRKYKVIQQDFEMV